MRTKIALIVLVLGICFAFYWRHQEKNVSNPTTPSEIKTSENVAPENSFNESFVPSPVMRVSLTNSARNSFEFSSSKPCLIQTGVNDSESVTLEPVPRGGIVRAASGPQGIQLGDETYPTSLIKVIPESSPDLWVNDHQYRGEIWFHRLASGRLVAVNHVPLEEYLGSVVDSEMPASFPDEARKAQAIIARTYALYRRQVTVDDPYFDLYATTLSQQYLGVQYWANGRRLAGESLISRRLVQETTGLVCLYENELFSTYYSAVCGGKTTHGSILFPDAVPLLQEVPCEYCSAAELYKWDRKWSLDQASEIISRAASSRGRRLGQLASVKMQGSEAGPDTRYQFEDGRSSLTLSGQEIRNLFSGLPSPTFSLEVNGSELIFHGAGHGHGVGLCQWGARGMAMTGKQVDEILQHYYPGVTISSYRE
ncbi:MAG: SpoIID/LytB domain-containing protein [Planctomycetaceae bacterium]